MYLWFPMYPWVGALESRYARLWYMAVSAGTVCSVTKGKVTNILVS